MAREQETAKQTRQSHFSPSRLINAEVTARDDVVPFQTCVAPLEHMKLFHATIEREPILVLDEKYEAMIQTIEVILSHIHMLVDPS